MIPEQQETQLDYSWLQTTPNPNIQPPKSRYRKVVIFVAAVAAIVILVVALFAITQREPISSSIVVDGAVTADDAVPAVTAAQGVISFLGQDDLSAAADMTSLLHDWEGSLADAMAAGYFGTNVDWASCRTVKQPSHKAEIRQFNGDDYDSVRTAHTCTKSNRVPVIVVLEMRRNTTQNGQWLLGQVVEVRSID